MFYFIFLATKKSVDYKSLNEKLMQNNRLLQKRLLLEEKDNMMVGKLLVSKLFRIDNKFLQKK
jgi:hypothetical protein